MYNEPWTYCRSNSNLNSYTWRDGGNSNLCLDTSNLCLDDNLFQLDDPNFGDYCLYNEGLANEDQTLSSSFSNMDYAYSEFDPALCCSSFGSDVHNQCNGDIPALTPDEESPGPLIKALLECPNKWKQATSIKKGLYVCVHCSKVNKERKTFKSMMDMAKHLDEENYNPTCKCEDETCAWSIIGFATKSEQMRHMRAQHQLPKKSFNCSHCSRSFARNDALARHCRLVHSMTDSSKSKKNGKVPRVVSMKIRV